MMQEIEKYKFVEIVKKNKFSKILKTTKNDKVFAIRIIDEPLEKGSIQLKRWIRELLLLQNSRHENVMNLVDHHNFRNQIDRENPYITKLFFVMPWMDYTLADLIDEKQKWYEKFGQECLRSFMAQLLNGVNYLHSNGIIHRNLSTTNVLVDQNWQLKIANFGIFYEFIKKQEKMNKKILNFRSWELALKNAKHDEKVDLWSIGCIFVEFLTGQPLFRQIIFDVRILFNAILSVAELPPNFDQNSFLTKNKFVTLPKLPIKRKPIVSRISAANFPRNDGTDDDENHNAKNGIILLKNLLQLMPENRWSASQALQSPFLLHESPKTQFQPLRNANFIEKAFKIMKNELLNALNSFPGQDCTEPCLSQMQRDLHGMEEMPTSPGASSWSHLLQNSRNKDLMASFFQKICSSYENADHCLKNCESRSRTGVNIRQTYAGLKFICKDVKEDFFSALPCLADFEPVAMIKCQKEINQSHSTTAQFTASIANRELHSIKSRFQSLCADLSSMIECMEPVIRDGCGNAPTNMMLKFITLEFTSFEQLYGQLGFPEPLPPPCRSLLSMPQIRQRHDPLSNEIIFDVDSFSNHANSAIQIGTLNILFFTIFFLFQK